MARSKKQPKKVKIDKYSKVEPQVSKWTIIGIVGFILVMAILVIVSIPNNQQKIYNAYKPYVTSQYFTEDHPFYQLSSNQVRNRIEKEEVFFLYIGNERCQACVLTIGSYQRYFESKGMSDYVKYIYYLNPQGDQTAFEKLMSEHSQIQDFTPQLLLFINGEIVLAYEAPTVENPTEANINTKVSQFFDNAKSLMNE